MADVETLKEEPQEEEISESVKSEPDETSEETPNGVKMEEEGKPPKEKHDGKEKSSGGRRGGRYHPYKDKHGGEKKGAHRNRVFISNIPYDMKWQAIKDLMRDKVGEVTYVELFKDAEGKSRVSDVFKDEEFVKKAVLTMNKHDLSGRPLNIKEDPDGEHARRVLQRMGGGQQGGRGQDMGPGVMNLPPSIANNPNIPPEVIHALEAGRLGNTVFVANLDFKVGWKKLKEVFSMAGVVKRADVKEDKDGKSRGMGTVTFEQPLEAVQAISMFNGQMLFDRQMHVKMDEKSLPAEDFRQVEKAPQLPRGLGGIGMGLGPGGQPINANRLSGGSGMSSMGPGDMYRSGMGGMDRDFGHGDMPMNRGFGDSFGGMGGGMGNMSMDRMGSSFDRLGMSGMDMNRGFGGYGGGGRATWVEACRTEGQGPKQVARYLCILLSQFGHCSFFSATGQVMFAEIKMENGKSKGCGTVRFDSPESAEKACRMMNGTKINGREVDVRIDRNA
uniref:Myelin expression factor 2 n=1 Tax=Oreochromis niloticus TaxID=8128 RepID=A0A669CE25_ORENI